MLWSSQDSTVIPTGEFLDISYLKYSVSLSLRSDPSAGELVQRHRLSNEENNKTEVV